MSQTDTTYEDEYEDEYDEDEDEEDDRDPDWAKKLRKRNKELAKRAKRADELEAKWAERERKDALTAAGFAPPPPSAPEQERRVYERRVKALQAAHDGDWTPDAVKATAVDLGWVRDESEEVEQDLAAEQRVAEASVGAGSPGGGVITPETYAGWPLDKRRAFMSKHPEHFEAIKRGDEVRGVNF